MGLFDGNWGALYQMGYDPTSGMTPDQFIASRQGGGLSLGFGGVPSASSLPEAPSDGRLRVASGLTNDQVAKAAQQTVTMQGTPGSGGYSLIPAINPQSMDAAGAYRPGSTGQGSAPYVPQVTPGHSGLPFNDATRQDVKAITQNGATGTPGGMTDEQRRQVEFNNSLRRGLIGDVQGMADPYDTNGTTFKNLLMGNNDRATLAYNQALAAQAMRGPGGQMGGLGMGSAAGGLLDAAHLQSQQAGEQDLYKQAFTGHDDFTRWQKGLLGNLANQDLGFEQLQTLQNSAEQRRQYDQSHALALRQSDQQQNEYQNGQMGGLLGNLAQAGVMGASLYFGQPGLGAAAAPVVGAAVNKATTPQRTVQSIGPGISPMAPSLTGQGLMGQSHAAVGGSLMPQPARLGYSSILPHAATSARLGFPKYKMGG